MEEAAWRRGRNEKRGRSVVFHKVNSNFLKGKKEKGDGPIGGPHIFKDLYTNKKKISFFLFFESYIVGRGLSHTHTHLGISPGHT